MTRFFDDWAFSDGVGDLGPRIRGGSLLVVPAASEAWLESMVQPITYSVSPPFSGLRELAKANGGDYDIESEDPGK